MNKKYQIFISSTYTDLKEERDKVRDTILSMLHFPVGMEIFGAADENQWEIIKDTIDSSDYYVLIVANRYGSLIPDGPDVGISYTEKEYRYAKEIGLPVLAFLIDDDVPVSKDKFEKDNIAKLEAFKSSIKSEHLIDRWKNPDDLAQKVSVALMKQMGRRKRPGWIRDIYDSEATLAEIVRLNTQIRNLESENQKMKEDLEAYRQSKGRAPKLNVTINVDTIDDELGNTCHMEYALQDEHAFINGVKILKVSVEENRSKYSKITMDDIPIELRDYSYQSEIDEYNASLPSQDQVNAYLADLEEYLQNTESCVHINIDVRNDGNAKADNVSAKIEFPEGVLVIDDIDIIIEPDAPKLPESPIDKAEKRRDEEICFALNIPKILAEPITMPTFTSTDFDLFDTVQPINCDYTFDNNTVEIECGTIIHTKSYRKRGLFLVGKKPGKYRIKCTLMCEEYEEPEVQYIDFEIIEMDEGC